MQNYPYKGVASLSAFMSHTPLDQDFRNFYSAIKRLLIILRHHNATLGRSTALRCRIHPLESIRPLPLPEDPDVPTVDVRRRHLLFGQFAKDTFQLFDETGGVFGDGYILRLH